jgi:hypothetical protein
MSVAWTSLLKMAIISKYRKTGGSYSVAHYISIIKTTTFPSYSLTFELHHLHHNGCTATKLQCNQLTPCCPGRRSGLDPEHTCYGYSRPVASDNRRNTGFAAADWEYAAADQRPGGARTSYTTTVADPASQVRTETYCCTTY